MNNEELSNLIIRELSHHHDRNAVINKVCEQSTLTWGEADRLIAEVQAQNKWKIVVGQSPFLIFLSIGTLLLGILLLAISIQSLLGDYDRVSRSLQYVLTGLTTGFGMTVGGLYGMWKTVATLFRNS